MDKDELGAVRHAMTAKELDDLYKRLENFIADCTRSELTPTGMRLTRCKA